MNSIKKYKLGFIGGSIESAVGQAHQIASQMDGRWVLEAGCFSRTSKINRETARRWGISPDRNYDSAEELIENESANLDAVVILTPTPTHIEWVKKSLKAGLTVICEKSLAASSAEVEEMIRTAKSKGKLLAVTFNYSGYPMVRELKALISDSVLGEIKNIQVEMPQEGFLRIDSQGHKLIPQTWRLSDEKIPVISLDLGVHLHHLVNFLTNERPVSVIADSASNGWFENIVDDVNCLVRYTNGLRCNMWYSKSALGHRNGLRLRVYGTKASAEWYQMTPEQLLLSYQNGERKIVERGVDGHVMGDGRYNRFKAGHPAGFIEAFANLYVDIAEHIEFQEKDSSNHDFVFGAEHALEGLKLFEALHRSVTSGKWELIE